TKAFSTLAIAATHALGLDHPGRGNVGRSGQGHRRRIFARRGQGQLHRRAFSRWACLVWARRRLLCPNPPEFAGNNRYLGADESALPRRRNGLTIRKSGRGSTGASRSLQAGEQAILARCESSLLAAMPSCSKGRFDQRAKHPLPRSPVQTRTTPTSKASPTAARTRGIPEDV